MTRRSPESGAGRYRRHPPAPRGPTPARHERRRSPAPRRRCPTVRRARKSSASFSFGSVSALDAADLLDEKTKSRIDEILIETRLAHRSRKRDVSDFARDSSAKADDRSHQPFRQRREIAFQRHTVIGGSKDQDPPYCNPMASAITTATAPSAVSSAISGPANRSHSSYPTPAAASTAINPPFVGVIISIMPAPY